MSRRSRKSQALARRPAVPPSAAPPSNVVQLRTGDESDWRLRGSTASGLTQMDLVRLVGSFDQLDTLAVNGTDGFRRMTLKSKRDSAKHEPGSVDPPLGIVRREWNAETIQRALDAHEIGLFSESALLADAMVGDARITHAINVGCKGFLNRKPFMLPPKRAKDQKLAKRIAEEMQEVYSDIVTPEVAETTMFRYRMMGFKLDNVTWEENQGLTLPCMRHWHEAWSFFLMAGDLEDRVLQAITMDSTIPIHDDDEDWFLFAPFGKYRGWIRAGILQVAIPWLVRNLSLRDWARLSEVHGIPIRIIKVPASASEPDKARLFAETRNMGNEATFILPVAGDGSGFSVELLEPTNTKSWEVMSELGHRCDSDIEIALAGTQLLSALGDQSSGGKSSSMAASKTVQNEQDDYSEQDAIRFSFAFRRFILTRTVLYNYGPEAEDCVPMFSLSNEAPKDKSDTAKCWLDVSQAFVNFQTAGVPITKEFLEAAKEEFEIPFDATADLQPPQAPGGAGDSSLKQLPGNTDDSDDEPTTEEARGSMVVQTILIDKGRYSLEQAKKWLSDHDFDTGVDEKATVYRFRQREPGDFDANSFRTVSIAKGIQFVIGRIKRHDPQPTVKGDDPEALRRAIALLRPHVDRLDRIFESATTPEELKREQRSLASEMRTRLQEFENALGGIKTDLRKMYSDDQPRDDHGRFDNGSGGSGGGGTVHSDKHGEGRVHTRDDLLKSVPKDAKGKQTYEGFPVGTINKVHEFSGKTGLKAVIYRQDRNGKEVQTYKYTSEHDQQHADARFAKAAKMGEHMHELRATLEKDSHSSDVKTRDAAVVTRLIDHTTIRVGGSDSEKDTGSVGATTLRAEHVHVNPDKSVDLRFPGKSHKDWDRHIEGPLAHELASRAEGKAPGDQIFKVNASDVNKYLEHASPIKITAKDFRTFHASSMAHSILSKASPPPKVSAKEAEATIKKAIEATSKHLGNTPAICKEKYINPRVIDAYRSRAVEGKAA